MILLKQYTAKDKKTVINFMEELQDYLVQIDPMKRLRRLPKYGEAYTNDLPKKIKKNNGAIFIAEVENIPVGLVAGILNKQSNVELLGCVPTKSGTVLELIVAEKHRGKEIGKMLMNKIEEYFQQHGCKIILIEVFEPNNLAHKFYKKTGYNDRSIELIKEIS